ncbi:MAG: formyltetrahydrofolate deformylase, partial [Planctomycetes bacterium]|nr:formyltetrahydrofolate deformylase [Planctomycetota bacterium]
MTSAILKLNCADVKGIVYRVSEFIFERGGNIISSKQHKEELGDRFFMRVHFDIDELKCTRSRLEEDLRELALRFKMDAELSFSDRKKHIAVLVSKVDHCLYDIFLRHRYGELDGEISLILSNHPDLEQVAFSFRTPFIYVPVLKDRKQEAEEEMLRLFHQHQIDVVVMARYMQVLTPLILNAYPNAIINVHHGFLPAFKGARPYHQAYEKGVKMIGATSHYATEDLDMGP